MHWMSIITALILALASAFLVFVMDWEPWQAFLAVGCSAIGIILTLVITILLISKGEDRAEFWKGCLHTCRDDIDQLLKYFRIRR